MNGALDGVVAAPVDGSVKLNEGFVLPKGAGDDVTSVVVVVVPTVADGAVDAMDNAPKLRAGAGFTVVVGATAVAGGVVPNLKPAKGEVVVVVIGAAAVVVTAAGPNLNPLNGEVVVVVVTTAPAVVADGAGVPKEKPVEDVGAPKSPEKGFAPAAAGVAAGVGAAAVDDTVVPNWNPVEGPVFAPNTLLAAGVDGVVVVGVAAGIPNLNCGAAVGFAAASNPGFGVSQAAHLIASVLLVT